MTLKEAAKQALDALTDFDYDKRLSAITALRQALEQADEPVAWRFRTGTFWNREVHWRFVLSLEGTEGLKGLEPLYAHPQREWQGLTDEEIKACAEEHLYCEDGHYRVGFGIDGWDDFAKNIEAKLREKNGGQQ